MSGRSESLVSVRNLRKFFPIRKGLRASNQIQLRAVDDVSFDIRDGETLGLVGESGCGKSTLARCVVRLLEPTSGMVSFGGRDVTHLGMQALRPLRREMQLVFQDPTASLNPRKPAGRIIEDGLRVHRIGTAADRRQRVRDVLMRVGLAPEHANRLPRELSGGQRQRIGIARALVLGPRLIVADEPVSALDVSVQAGILNLFQDLRDEFRITYLFISHDLGVIRQVSDRVGVMYLGKLVELAPADAFYARPMHPLLGGAALRDSHRRSGQGAGSPENHRRGSAEPHRAPRRMSLPPEMHSRHGHLPSRGSAAQAPCCRSFRGLLSSPQCWLWRRRIRHAGPARSRTFIAELNSARVRV